MVMLMYSDSVIFIPSVMCVVALNFLNIFFIFGARCNCNP